MATLSFSRFGWLARLTSAVALSAGLASAPSAAAEWPTEKPITLVLGFSAGSGLDLIARAIHQPLMDALGQTVVIDYRAGAGGNLASSHVARSEPDGYTLLLGTAATHGINPAIYKNLSFDIEKDFTPIAPLVDVSNVLSINPKAIDVDTLEEFIAEVKANPGKYNFASTGVGTGTHLAFAEFNARAGLDMVHVPYKGGAEAVQAVLRGDACCYFGQVQSVLGQYQAGSLRLLAVSTAKRVEAVKDIPTIAESGLPGFDSYIWFGLFGPKGMDPELVEKINAAATKAVQDPEVVKNLNSRGNAPHVATTAEFRQLVLDNRDKWAEVVKEAGVEPQ